MQIVNVLKQVDNLGLPCYIKIKIHDKLRFSFLGPQLCCQVLFFRTVSWPPPDDSWHSPIGKLLVSHVMMGTNPNSIESEMTPSD